MCVSQPTVSRTITIIEKALEKVLTPLAQPLQESLKAPGSAVVDGTLVPTWNWRSLGTTNFSKKTQMCRGKPPRHLHPGRKLLAITDPVPGARDDAYPFKHHDLQKYLDESTLADKGYIGLGLATPTKRKPGQRLSAEAKKITGSLIGCDRWWSVSSPRSRFGRCCIPGSGVRWARMVGCFR